MQTSNGVNKKFLAITITLFAALGLLFAGGVQAGPEHNVSGWAWSSNIGWISFNCTNRGTCGSVNYGVHINPVDGTFSGFAWSGNIGWIHFAPAGPYPDTGLPNHSARVDLANGQVSGWARALAHGSGWDGWIKMRDGTYGVSINFGTGDFSGFAWGSDVIGWVSFSGANYKVITSFVPPPSISNLGNVFTPCSQSRIPTFSWNTNAIMPYDYEIRLCSNPGCTGPRDPLVSRLVENIRSTSWAPGCSLCCPGLPYSNIAFGGITYHGQVRARNRPTGTWGSWTISAFTTYLHCYPSVDFTWLPTSPNVNEVVQFTDGSIVYSTPPTKTSFFWTFPDGSPDTSSVQNATTTFTSAGSKNVSLRVRDLSGFKCTATRSVSITLPLPEWREIAPFGWLRKLLAGVVDFVNGFGG